MATLDKNNILTILSEAIKFSNGIDRYTQFLGLNPNEVATFKNDVELLKVIIDHSDSFSEGFIYYNTISIQWRLTQLITQCTASNNYTEEIGEVLGIRFPLDNTEGLGPLPKHGWPIDLADPQSFLY
ncbi:MAG: hypothetical protein KIS94_09415 [Chitinophagales bacterium]|nr:hypothetical protein [Chitinophagales bacterium]